jgi:hypothetical protein
MASMSAPPVDVVAARLAEVRLRLAELGRDPASIRIVGVTKGWGPATVAAALEAGLADLGENYAQELTSKAAAIAPRPVRWHFIGPIQRNKVKGLASLVSAWHGVDRPEEADAVSAVSPGVEVLVQVNVTGDPTRPGCRPAEVAGLVEHCRSRPVDLTGLMTVGPAGDRQRAQECFRWLADQAQRLGLKDLSMGMSDDFEMAAAEGATTLRLGRALFGARPRRQAAPR